LRNYETFAIVENIRIAGEKNVGCAECSTEDGFELTAEMQKPPSATACEERLVAINRYERARSLRLANFALR
jgi:hypothetical protein